MANLIKIRRDDATYWELTGTNKYGNPSSKDPVEIKIYLESVEEDTQSPTENKSNVMHIASVDREIPKGSIFFLGLINDISSDPELFVVLDVENSKTHRTRKWDRWVKLGKYTGQLPETV